MEIAFTESAATEENLQALQTIIQENPGECAVRVILQIEGRKMLFRPKAKISISRKVEKAIAKTFPDGHIQCVIDLSISNYSNGKKGGRK